MSDDLFNKVYNPDVLSCLANLSNDEVFTSPDVVNQMLDMLPQELFENPDTTFLDPACKTGVFLREIAKRLLKGLENQIPDLQERVDHIFHKQLYGIAITELTSLLSRRGVYCSKYANGEFSITKFQNADGNIRFKNCNHTFKNGKCIYCGASEQELGGKKREELETHAYEFIHGMDVEEVFKMKFDVIISNPPYQLNDGGAQASASPIYQKFIQQAIKLKPRYMTMIVPSRWMTGGKGLDDFRNEMLHDNRMSLIHDFKDASLCFTGVEIKGGVNYFLWDRDKTSPIVHIINDNGAQGLIETNRAMLESGCEVFIRNNELVSIYRKVKKLEENSFSLHVSPRKPNGFCGDMFKCPEKYGLPALSEKPIKNGYCIYGLDGAKRAVRYIPSSYPIPKRNYINDYKMFMARNQGSGLFGEKFSEPIFAKPGELCTETFVVIGGFKTKEEMMNCWSYIKTKFFRALVGVKKNDQGAASGVYQYVPLQDFSKPWTDQELYEKYGLDQSEIDFIENNVESMED